MPRVLQGTLDISNIVSESSTSLRHELLLHHNKVRHSTKLCHIFACTRNMDLLDYILPYYT